MMFGLIVLDGCLFPFWEVATELGWGMELADPPDRHRGSLGIYTLIDALYRNLWPGGQGIGWKWPKAKIGENSRNSQDIIRVPKEIY